MKKLPKTYDPGKVEDKWYEYWEEKGFFEAETKPDRESFSIVMPPPNITGQLHLGHALDNTLQDILTRWKRMKGYNTLWLPGTDHASIATEVKVVDKIRDEGLDKDSLGRDGFLKRAWEWKEEYGGRITSQLRKLGSSCDWSRERFTMDEGCSRAVREVFVELYKRGLIYQGDYIVNWCPDCHTTLSDIEVEHEEKEGKLYHIKYPLKDGDGYITVATTRPETMLGDTAVAVHPGDDRYKDLVGSHVVLPLMDREIPIIADEYVDSEFGTGMVKVTPAHDPNDFEMGQRHDLPLVKVIDEDAKMTEEAGDYAGLDRYECREKVVEDLKKQGLLEKIEDHQHSVGQCYRCDTVIEPLVSKQWFVKMKPLAEPAIRIVKEGKVRFVPERFSKVYLNWMENIQDWCISRQLWWGHRIPVWYCQDCGETIVSKEEEVKVCPGCGSENLKQDEDVLDTWFSSALWPFSTMGWPDRTEDLDYFYPTDVLVTGRDIIFFWVARMIFMALEFMDEPPFKDVYIHGLIRDALGRKMSKSLGNGIDPLEVVEKYGADALRFMLITGNTPGNDMRFREERLEASRNFANKIWNAARFILMNTDDLDPSEIDENDLKLTLADKWMLSRLQKVIEEVDKAFEKYYFGEAAKVLYDFIWSEFCDWYIELIKPRLYQDKDVMEKRTAQYTGLKVLEKILRLLHPVMPFITEEIWQQLSISNGESIMISSWPEVESELINEEVEEHMQLIMNIIKSIRNIRNEMKVNPGRRITAILNSPTQKLELLEAGAEYIKDLARVKELTITESLQKKPDKVSTAVVNGVEIILPLEGMVDLEKEVERLKKEMEKVDFEINRARGKLANEGFVNKAPQHLVEAEREKLKTYQDKKEKLLSRLKELK
ncbi:valine--tRNA ligase [Halothermothrix orenii]|uniref:Valine--tRNA ligase n=1 Tax=Halothermothrix orenii (strain H 168 / OCM 544 / DSM 9562) TaxID=373903 RepID=B8CY39_HALOH|nr:valine--tRNA ligase [Halothermothrix orenii]ACL70208.1 valyl-tRNA synthetase [Halothermothrix orenii H 168]